MKPKSKLRLAIIKSRFNEEIVTGLLQGSLSVLKEKKIAFDKKDLFEAPGAFEIPLIAMNLAKSKRYDGVIALGCVIKGDTAHFEFISLGATLGIQLASLQTNTPISFGILTTYTEEQALVRSRSDSHNKGREAALACIDALIQIRSIR